MIEWIRGGVGFIPDAAAAFRRAEAQVRGEFGRGIDVNSTYRDWDTQMRMHLASVAYAAGRGPYPGHSFATHPSQSFHVGGTALDSDDWRVPRIVQILAANGFIRNRLYVPNEQHHFEWLRDRDRNYGRPAPAATEARPLVIAEDPEEDDMALQVRQVHATRPDGATIRALTVPGTGYWMPWTEKDATYANRYAREFETGDSVEVSYSLFKAMAAAAAAMLPKDQVQVEITDAEAFGAS